MGALSDHKAPPIPTLMHVTIESQGLPTSLTPGWDQAGSHIWGDMYGYSHAESARPAPQKSLGSVNNPPEVLLTIPALTATVGFPFSYLIPENTFVDPEDGAADSLSIQMTLIDPPPPSVGSWLFLDGLELHGIPLEIDTPFAPQHATLLSRDKGGLTILYFCQRTTGVVAIFPANHTLSEWGKDLRALRPRRAPLLQPEIPPPPLRLWIALNEANQNWQQQSDIDKRHLPSKYKFFKN
uniref:Uncharacterized protein n=1 Tax=Knipowitschia caucasica TaxID=637954 RepID=A0AAV2IYS1_KNICA